MNQVYTKILDNNRAIRVRVKEFPFCGVGIVAEEIEYTVCPTGYISLREIPIEELIKIKEENDNA